MIIQILLFIANALLLNVAFVLSFLVRYGYPFPAYNFAPYKESLVFLTLIYMSALSFFKVYKDRFKSSWDLFKRIYLGVFLGTLLSIAFVYVFRASWGAFPTSVFILSFFVILLFVFMLNLFALKSQKKIKKKIMVVGEGNMNDILTKNADVEKRRIDEIEQLNEYADVDEIIIYEKIQNTMVLNVLIYLTQRLKIEVVFDPSIYIKLLAEKVNSDNSVHLLSTFVGRKTDVEEFLIKGLDVVGSVFLLLVFAPVTILVSLLIKISSAGPVFYKQQRIGKDGKIFTLYKFRTMVKDAESIVGPVLASREDPRVTRIGKVLRATRLDELPQLFNVLRGDMSLVGPRPERPQFVRTHKALQELRLAVRPGITGLAQIRSFYDLKPKHKIRYDYLYIQQRSLLLNLYILARTVPVIFSKKGW